MNGGAFTPDNAILPRPLPRCSQQRRHVNAYQRHCDGAGKRGGFQAHQACIRQTGGRREGKFSVTNLAEFARFEARSRLCRLRCRSCGPSPGSWRQVTRLMYLRSGLLALLGPPSQTCLDSAFHVREFQANQVSSAKFEGAQEGIERMR